MRMNLSWKATENSDINPLFIRTPSPHFGSWGLARNCFVNNNRHFISGLQTEGWHCILVRINVLQISCYSTWGICLQGARQGRLKIVLCSPVLKTNEPNKVTICFVDIQNSCLKQLLYR